MIKTEINPDSVIKKKEDIIEEDLSSEPLLFDPLQGRLFETNEIGRKIWKFLDGKHTLEDIIFQIKEDYSDVKDLNEDLFKFLKKILELNLGEIMR